MQNWNTKKQNKGRSPVLVVMGSNPGTVFFMDIFSHIFDVQIVMFVWKDQK